MKQKHIAYKIIVVEDNFADYILFEAYAKECFDTITLVHLESFSAFENFALQHTMNDITAIFLDLSLPDHQGESLIKDVIKLANPTPVIVLSGNLNITLDAKSTALGINEYLIKDQLGPDIIHKIIKNNI